MLMEINDDHAWAKETDPEAAHDMDEPSTVGEQALVRCCHFMS
jgi:hypothetical protein